MKKYFAILFLYLLWQLSAKLRLKSRKLNVILLIIISQWYYHVHNQKMYYTVLQKNGLLLIFLVSNRNYSMMIRNMVQ